ncbi:translation initiation factor IF-2 [Tumebacillus avium]
MSSKEIITILNRVNVPVNNHMSVMDQEMISKVEQHFKDVKAKAEPQKGDQSSKQNGERRNQGYMANENSKGNPSTQSPQAKPENDKDYDNLVDDRVASQPRNERIPKKPIPNKPAGAKPATGGTTGGNRPSTTGGGNRPGGQGGNRPGGQGGGNRPGGQGGGNRPGGQGGGNRPGGQGGGNRGPSNNNRGGNNNNRGGGAGRGGNNNNRGGGRGGNQQGGHRPAAPKQPELPTKIELMEALTVKDFAKLVKREPSEIIKKLLFLGIMATINNEIEVDAMTLVAEDYGIEVEIKEPVDEEAVDMLVEEENPENLSERSPIVTIMGHVDHGKTTLLDAIRSTNVTASEAGGITQHIGAYQVEIKGKKITFLDTPGHAAFTTMRARGAQVTDITILVVAADDGVMPQTVEAINHAKAANVPIIVAVNKMDKENANPDRVKQELTEYGLVAEEWGGDTIFVPVSALKRDGLEDILEMILLVSEVQELKANTDGRPRGTVIEAELDKGRGPVATVLVQNGTLRVGDIVVAGTTYGKVRAMVNDRGRRIKEAGPAMPVEILGLSDVPSAGDLFVVYDDERKASKLVDKRVSKVRQEAIGSNSRVTLDDLFKQIKEGEIKELNVILKADVQGSVEALRGSLEKIEVEGVRVRVVHQGVGAINESDIILATASNAIVIGFNVRPQPQAEKMADSEKVDVRLYRVIYNAIEEVEAALKGMLDPEFKEVVLGRAEVRQTFKVSKVGTIAGCMVTEGKLVRNAELRVIRDGIVIFEGSFDSLKRFKDDAKEVATGFECGVTIEKFNDVKEGDIIEAFQMEQVKIV